MDVNTIPLYNLNVFNLSCNISQYQDDKNKIEFNTSMGKIETPFTAENKDANNVIIDVFGYIHLTVIVIGIIANILVLTLTILDKTLHKPTFTSIGALSAADTLCLCALLANEFVKLIKVNDVFMYIFFTFLITCFTNCTWTICHTNSSIFSPELFNLYKDHLRVFSLLYISNFHYANCFICYWHVCICFYHFNRYIVPFIMTAIFHAVKYYKLKKQSRRFNRNVDQMGRVVATIIGTCCVLPLARLIFNAVDYYMYYIRHIEYSNIEDILGLLSILLMTLNRVLNPFLYCFLSKSLRDSFKSFCCKCQCWFRNFVILVWLSNKSIDCCPNKNYLNII